MKNRIIKIYPILLILSIYSFNTGAQVKITGQAKDEKGRNLPYASIYLENTIDGTTTDSLGRYVFKTRQKGKQILVVSCIGYELTKDTVFIDKNIVVHNMTVKEKSVSMQEVVITAGAFAADDDQKVAIFKRVI